MAKKTTKHDPAHCGCRYLGNNRWSCGHVDLLPAMRPYVPVAKPPVRQRLASVKDRQPTVGCGVFVKNGNRILIGKRGPKSKSGAGCLALPGGRLEHGEEVDISACREVLEETGVDCVCHGTYKGIPGLLAVTDHINDGDGPYGTRDHFSFWMLAKHTNGEPKVKEPGKADWWTWMTLKEVRKLPGVFDPTSEQYYWIPFPLWQQILHPYFGAF